MSTYADAMDKLSDALMSVAPDGPEWVKIEAAITELTRAKDAEDKKAFVEATRGLDDAKSKLKAVVAGLNPNSASTALGLVKGALKDLRRIGTDVTALLSGEPASALPGTAMANTVKVSPDGGDADVATPEPAPRPLRERGRTREELKASPKQASPDEMIEAILKREGGFVDHPADRGGPTKYGVTQKTLTSWRGKSVDANDVRALREDEAKEIFRTRYYVAPKIDRLPQLIQPLAFDMSINHGPGTAIRLLQQVLNDNQQPCQIDGGIGDETLGCAQAAVDKLGNKLIEDLVERRIDLYRSIAKRDPSQRVFLKGWLQRAREFTV